MNSRRRKILVALTAAALVAGAVLVGYSLRSRSIESPRVSSDAAEGQGTRIGFTPPTATEPKQGGMATKTAPVLPPAKRLTLQQLVAAADTVALGRVDDVSSYKANGVIYSEIKFKIDISFKGVADDTISIKTLGGRVGNLALQIDGAPEYKQGEKAVVFLKPVAASQSGAKQGDYALVDFQGKFLVHKDPSTGEEQLIQEATGDKGTTLQELEKAARSGG